MQSHTFFSVTILTANTLSITSLQGTKLGFTVSSPKAKNQLGSGSTLDHQRERNSRLHPHPVMLWKPYSGIHMLLSSSITWSVANADRYCATLTRLHEAIRRKRPGMLNESILLYDKATPHSAQATQELLRLLRWEICNHLHTAQIRHQITISCFRS